MNSLDFAAFFLSQKKDKLETQKLLYYSEGIYEAIKDRHLFEEEIEHWKYGPVVRKVYNNWAEVEKRSINPLLFDKLEAYLPFLFAIIQHFSSFDGPALIEKTHKEPPWKQTKENEALSPHMHSFFRDFMMTDEGAVFLKIFQKEKEEEEQVKKALQELPAFWSNDELWIEERRKLQASEP